MTGATCDTSVLIAAFMPSHPRHTDAREAVDSRVTAVISHVLLETFSVLTRLPAPHRFKPMDVAGAIDGLPWEPLTLPASAQAELPRHLASSGIGGGSIYDGLIAATAEHHGLMLLTLDTRARATYEALQTRYEVL